jgi:hypothetical protein
LRTRGRAVRTSASGWLVSDTIQNHDELHGLASDFVRMGERMLSFFRQLEEKRLDRKPE